MSSGNAEGKRRVARCDGPWHTAATLRLDYAHVLNKESYDKVQQIRFGASTNF